MIKDYQLLFIGKNGVHSRAVHFSCSDDSAATIFAEDRRAEHVLELWQDRRMVAEFPKRQEALICSRAASMRTAPPRQADAPEVD